MAWGQAQPSRTDVDRPALPLVHAAGALVITPPPTVWLESHQRRGRAPRGPRRYGRCLRFDEPAGDLVVADIARLPRALRRVEAAAAEGLHAVGYVAYEAAAAADAALVTQPPAGPLPPAWFGFYRERRESAPPPVSTVGFEVGPWEPGLSAAAHGRAVAAIRDYIGAGDVYQVNLTFPLRARFGGDPVALYRALSQAQGGAAFCACLDLGEAAVVSASPELFFAVDADGSLRARPMKGTRPRGRWTAEDDALRRELGASEKERAENLMIVDLLRNDLGRVARAGSVSVPSLWDLEPYDTVWQLTSSVEGRLRPGVDLSDLFAALFPCGSVTGAPKVRSTQIIGELEAAPRGVYTGAIGFVSPAAPGSCHPFEAVFSVAIRTVTVDRAAGMATAGVGGGITWDSQAGAEYAECLDKARFLRLASTPRPGTITAPRVAAPPEDFELLETLLLEPGAGVYLVERHLRRLADSARYFGFDVDLASVRARLQAAAAAATRRQRLRLTVGRQGDVHLTAAPLVAGDGAGGWTAVVAPEPVDAGDVFLYHKTTRRGVYQRALAAARAAGADEVVLHNERGELTECAIGNLVVDFGEARKTPPLACGLLAGTFREELLDRGEIVEGVVTLAEAAAAEAIWLINSVRRWVRLEVRWPGDAEPTKES